jgi:hypothetical protein
MRSNRSKCTADLTLTDTLAITCRQRIEVDQRSQVRPAAPAPGRHTPDAVFGLHISGKKQRYHHQSRRARG